MKQQRTNRPKSKRTEQEKATRQRNFKLTLIGLIFSLSLIGLFGQVVYIKAAYGDKYDQLTAERQINASGGERTLVPNEGSILSRNKQILASSYSVYDISIDPYSLSKISEKEQTKTLAALNEILEEPMEKLQGYMTPKADGKLAQYQIVKKEVDQETTDALLATGAKCIYTHKVAKRTYPHGTLASQVVGFVRGDTRWGLEDMYREYIAGKPGKTFSTYDSENNPTTQTKEAIDGYSIVTTLDLTIQQYAEEAARKAGEEYESDKASVIVMNPNTGEILAMAEYPTFDLNEPDNFDLVQGTKFKSQLDELEGSDKVTKLNEVWGNYNITKTAEPGSIYKPFVVAAALEENIIGYDDSYFCDGGKVILGEPIPCWLTSGHGTQSLTMAMAHSCNSALIDIGLKLGKEKYYKYQHDFGFGEKTGIDLPGEVNAAGFLYKLSQLNPVEIAAGSMGQGFNSTPIQDINSFCSLINGGNLMRPYLVSQVVDSNNNIITENNPYVVRKVISRETSDYIRTALRQTVTDEGTGKKAVIEGYSIGGKTGTAQQGPLRDEYVISFIAYLPVENPEIIAMAYIDRPKEYITGVTTAAPALREVLYKIIQYKGIKPTGETSGNIQDDSGALVVGDYKGQSLDSVTRNLNDIGLDFAIIGNGDMVNSQMPTAGSKISGDAKIMLYLTESGTDEELVIVPDVIGLNSEQAAQAFESMGLSYRIFTDKEETSVTAAGANAQETAGNPEDGENPEEMAEEAAEESTEETPEGGDTSKTVYKQSPEGNARVPAGTEVRLMVKTE